MNEVLDDAQLAQLELAEREEKPAPRPRVSAKGLAGSGSRPLTYSAPDENGSVKTAAAGGDGEKDPYAGVGRNAPCPCGSGKKFKMCHGRPGAKP
jgi:preprotein translocase subunit SecA